MSDTAAQSGTHLARRQSLRHGALGALEKGGLGFALVLIALFFAIDPTSGEIFRSSANISNILEAQSVVAIVALAMVIPLVAGYFDLSIGATTGLANIAVAASLGKYGLPIVVSILIGLLIGVLVGVINGILVAYLKLNAFVITLGTYTLIEGILQWYTSGAVITQGIPTSFGRWGALDWLGVPRPFYVLAVVTVVTWYLLRQFPLGRYLEAIGSNESAARLVGINVDRSVFLSFVSAGLLAGVAGALLTARTSVGDPAAGPSYLFPALAAVFLGATTIRPGRYNVWGTIVGVYLVAVSVSGLTLLGADVWVTPVFDGAALIAAVAFSTLLARRREKSRELVTLHPRSTGAQPDDPVPARAAGRRVSDENK